MKRLFALLIIVVILSGCSDEKNMGHALTLRKNIQAEDECAFNATVTADYGDKLYTFQMSCQVKRDGTLYFEVVQPDTISGIAGNVSEQGGKLNFDDRMLAFELLADGQLSPVSAPWVVMHAIRSGYIRSCGIDGDDVHIQIDDTYRTNSLLVDIWCDESYPKYAEILYGGKRILSMKIENFRFM